MAAVGFTGCDGFEGVHWGANPCGIHVAATVDWMHAMLQGIGKHLVNFICSNLRKWKLQTHVNQFMSNLNRRSCHPFINLKYLTQGANGLDLQDATDIPGIVTQLGIALGDRPPGYTFPQGNHQGLTKNKLTAIQRTIYLFLRACRQKRRSEHTTCQIMDFETTIVALLQSLRDSFQHVSGSACCMPKFHSPLHFGLQISLFGNLFYTDTNMWEHFHQVAAKKVYNQTAKRKKTLEEDMAAQLDKSGEFRWLFDQLDTPSCIKPRHSPSADLSTYLEEDESFRMTETYTEVEWDADEVPDNCPIDYETFDILRNRYAEYDSEHTSPVIGIGSHVVFRNQLFKQTRFADQEVIRLRAIRNYQSTGEWFDGVATVCDSGHGETTRRPTPLTSSRHSKTLIYKHHADRQFRKVVCIFAIGGTGDVYLLCHNLKPLNSSRTSAKQGGHPIAKWACQSRIVYNWPLLKLAGTSNSCFEVVLLAEVESCVYLAQHAHSDNAYWAIVDADEMPHQQVYYNDDDDVLYEETPSWFSKLGRRPMVDLEELRKQKLKKRGKSPSTSQPTALKWYNRTSTKPFMTVQEFDAKLGLTDMCYLSAQDLVESCPNPTLAYDDQHSNTAPEEGTSGHESDDSQGSEVIDECDEMDLDADLLC